MKTENANVEKSESDYRRSVRLLVRLWDFTDCDRDLTPCSKCAVKNRCDILYAIYSNYKNAKENENTKKTTNYK